MPMPLLAGEKFFQKTRGKKGFSGILFFPVFEPPK
jgi:hypothetical protein